MLCLEDHVVVMLCLEERKYGTVLEGDVIIVWSGGKDVLIHNPYKCPAWIKGNKVKYGHKSCFLSAIYQDRVSVQEGKRMYLLHLHPPFYFYCKATDACTQFPHKSTVLSSPCQLPFMYST